MTAGNPKVHTPLIVFPRPGFRHMLLAVFLIMTFGIFKYFPGMIVLKELWNIAAFFFLAIPFAYWKTKHGLRFSLFELYLIGMMAFIPFLSGIAAWREFGQPIIYGVLAQREMILSSGALALIFAFRQKWLRIIDVEETLVLLAWSTMFLYILLNALFDPSQFTNIQGFAGGGNVEEETFKFNSLFIIFGFLYYAFIGIRQNSKKAYLLTLPFIIYLIILDGGRSMLVSVFACLMFFIYRWSSFTRLLLFAPKFIAAGLMLITLLHTTNPEYITHFGEKLSDAFTVALTGAETHDASANARIIETAVAMPYISKHWVIGNGNISNQWHGGYREVLGAYFYPSDIGIIGVLYLFGITGVLLFSLQFLFAWHASKRLRFHLNLHLLDAAKGYLFYYAVHSLVTGRFAHLAPVGFMFIAIVICIAYESNANITVRQNTAMDQQH